MALSVVMVVKVLFDKNLFFKVSITIGIFIACIAKKILLPDTYVALSWYVNWTFCFIYFEAGALFKQLDISKRCREVSDLHRVEICVAELALLLLFSILNGLTVIASFAFGKSLIVAVIAAFIGTDFVLIVSTLIKKYLNKFAKICSLAGRHSLAIMLSHYYFFHYGLVHFGVIGNTIAAIIFVAFVTFLMHMLTTRKKSLS